MLRNSLSVYVFICSFSFVHCDFDNIVLIKAKNSNLVGKRLYTIFEDNPYAAFWRIPYAVPPVKDRRFKPPLEIVSFDEDVSYIFSYPYNDTCAKGLTEDCLYLSVYMPLIEDKKNNFSVIVWIHEQSNLHQPDFFIDEEVLVVAVNYRTSILGFLNTGDDFAEGNMGAKDLILALKWIKENIGFFKGDVNKVTVVGSGSAAVLVASLLVSKAAEDLFDRVIIQSGSALSPADYRMYNFETLTQLYWKLNGNYNFNRTKLYEMLNNATLKDLTKLSEDLHDSSQVRDRQRLINSFGPSIEDFGKNAFMTKHPVEIYKRKMANNNVDIMMGYTSLESIYKLKGLAENKKLLKYLNFNFQYLLPFEGRADEYGSTRYSEIAIKIMDFYFLNGTVTDRSLRRYAKYVSDQVIYPLLRQAKLHAETSCSNVYLYRFTYKGRLNIGWQAVNSDLPGATAGDEICYLFRCKSANEVYEDDDAATERLFIKKIARLWANFAKFGNPTPKTKDYLLGDLKWEPLSRDGKLRGMTLDKKMKMVKLPEQKRVQFWDELREEFFADNEISIPATLPLVGGHEDL